TDLPDFVHSNRRDVKGGRTDAFVSLETPVIYFYTDRDRTVSVHVNFPKGVMTDWYPEASRPPSRLAPGRVSGRRERLRTPPIPLPAVLYRRWRVLPASSVGTEKKRKSLRLIGLVQWAILDSNQ